jgi:hypothetical protein
VVPQSRRAPQAIEHWLATQFGVPLLAGHFTSHVAQWLGSVFESLSHPSSGSLLQSLKPAAQLTIVQRAPLQTDAAWFWLQSVSQLPQCKASVVRFVSHPSDGSLLQSANPSLHTMEQVPPLHDGLP